MEAVADPRCDRKKKHVLAEILTYLVVGYVTGHTTIRRCLAWCRRHENWLKKGLCLKNGIASVSTVSRLLSSIDEEIFLYAFMEWIGEILNTKGIHLAIDGKAIRGAMKKTQGTNAKIPVLLHAIDTATGLVLAQLPVPEKTNEITGIHEILRLLDIRGSIITIDAIGTQTDIMEEIIERGGHFELMVKKNWILGYEEITSHMAALHDDYQKAKACALYQPEYPEFLGQYEELETFEKNRDRYEYRSYQVCNNPECVTKTKKEWGFIKSVGCVSQTRILLVRDAEGNDITPDKETFLKEGSARQPLPTSGDSHRDDIQVVGIVSDMELTVEEMAQNKRNHWAVENRLHHVLDDTFREDRSPAKGSKHNLALIRKFAYNIIRIIMRKCSLEQPITEIMDLLSDDLDLLGKYIFKGIASFY
jgi:predicted transposase YbfD/YdcC